MPVYNSLILLIFIFIGGFLSGLLQPLIHFRMDVFVHAEMDKIRDDQCGVKYFGGGVDSNNQDEKDMKMSS